MTKQYLLLCDELGVNVLKNAFRPEVLQFIEIQGVNLNDENRFNVLVSPIPQIIKPEE